MAQVRDMIKINVAPEIVWRILPRHIAVENADQQAWQSSYEDDEHRGLEERSGYAGKDYEPSSLGLVSQPQRRPQNWGELTIPILKRNSMIRQAFATFSVESHEQGTVVRMSIDYNVVMPGVVLTGWGKRVSLGPGLLGKLFMYPRVGRRLLRSIQKTLMDLKKQIEAGHVVAG